MANEFKVKNGLILESGSLSDTPQQFILTYNTSSGQVFYASGSGGGGGGGSSIILSGSDDTSNVISNFPFIFTGEEKITSGTSGRYRLSGSFVSLDAGTYQIYLSFCVTSAANAQASWWISSDANPNITDPSNPNGDPNRIPGSVIRGAQAQVNTLTSPRITILTNKFTINSPTQYYIIGQSISAAASPIPVFTITRATIDQTRTYIVYKYE